MLISSRGCLLTPRDFFRWQDSWYVTFRPPLAGPSGCTPNTSTRNALMSMALAPNFLAVSCTEAGKFRDISGQYSLMVIVQDEHGVTM